MDKINIFGATGFIGSQFYNCYKEYCIIQEKDDNIPKSNNILYLISTVDNYNVFDNPNLDIDTNLSKLVEVLKNCKDKNITFNFVSSWFVYGKLKNLPAKETYTCNPSGFYSITKKCAEDLLISYCNTFNIKYRILRLSNVYGNTDINASIKKNALQYLVMRIKNNDPIDLYNDGNFTRDYIHVTDACRAINLCIESAGLNEIINIGSGKKYKFKKLIDFLIKMTDSKSIVSSKDPSEFHKLVQVKDMYLDVAKLKRLGFKENFNIFDGLETLI